MSHCVGLLGATEVSKFSCRITLIRIGKYVVEKRGVNGIRIVPSGGLRRGLSYFCLHCKTQDVKTLKDRI